MSQEHCPFCAMPILREYGSFRCKSCAKSSEDMIDLERKARAAEVRKAARAARAVTRDEVHAAETKKRMLALALARHAARKKEQVLVGAGAGSGSGSKKTAGRRA